MKIDGKALANDILAHLANDVAILKKQAIIPHLAVLLVGDDENSESYVRQKQIKAEKIGVTISLFRFPTTTTTNALLEKVRQLNANPTVHGIIVQRPLPETIDGKAIQLAVDPLKDIDGFHPQTAFCVPVAEAVLSVLQTIALQEKQNFTLWITKQRIVVLGKGETAGRPIIHLLEQLGCYVTVIDRKTKEKETLLQQGDIIIAAVGQPAVFSTKDIKKDAIVITVGMYRDAQGKLQGDFKQEELAAKASYYTPTPGGIGPINVAMLLKNLIQAAQESV